MRTITQQSNPENPKIRKIGVQTIAAILAIATAFNACSSDDGDGGGGGGGVKGTPVTDVDGQTYKTVVIGTQTWMAENLNYNAKGSVCYDNKPANCEKYGRLYDWTTAKRVCPSGWHLPSNADWDKLMRYVDGDTGTESPYESETAGRHLKAKSGWNSGGNGTDTYGFSALPGGRGNSGGSFDVAGNIGYWWSAIEYSSSTGNAYYRRMHYNDANASWADTAKDRLQSVRCVMD